jgi:NADPH-dependent 2,4-dienoyl-CoA reductase/sulfur reductase-like enzyme
MTERIVIVGGGLAGVRSGERLREMGFDGEIVIVSAERHLPYHRPALSKEVITGELHWSDLGLATAPELDAQWRMGVMASGLDTSTRTVSLPGGEELRYDGLVIATGVDSRHLDGVPRHDPRVHQLRTLDDAVGIRKAMSSSQGQVVVIGGGFIGAEIAASIRHMGREVAVVIRGKALLGGAIGEEFGNLVTQMHRDHGVRLASGVKILHWVRQAGGIAIHLSDGQVLFAAAVVLAVGATPSVAWLRGSGLELSDGVLCEQSCHVVGADDVVAAGDVARWPNHRFGGVVRRVEHYIHAVEMARAAAENLLVGRAHARPFTPVPRFWTEQYGMRVQGSGIPKLGTDTTPLGRGVTGFVADGRLVGMVGLDAPNAMIRHGHELRRQTALDRERVDVLSVPPTRAPGPQPVPPPPPTLRDAAPFTEQLPPVREPVPAGAPPREPQGRPDLVWALPAPRR